MRVDVLDLKDEKMTEALATLGTELQRLHSLLADMVPDLKKVECQCKCNSPQPETEHNEPETQIPNAAKEADDEWGDDESFTIASIGEWNGGNAMTMPALESILDRILKDSPTVRFTLDPKVFVAIHKARCIYSDFPKVEWFLKAHKPYEFIIHKTESERYQVASVDDIESDEPDIDEACPHLLFDVDKNLVCECDDDGIEAEVKVDPYYDLLSLSKLLGSEEYDFTGNGIELLHNFLLAIKLYNLYGKTRAIRPGLSDNDEDD